MKNDHIFFLLFILYIFYNEVTPRGKVPYWGHIEGNKSLIEVTPRGQVPYWGHTEGTSPLLMSQSGTSPLLRSHRGDKLRGHIARDKSRGQVAYGTSRGTILPLGDNSGDLWDKSRGQVPYRGHTDVASPLLRSHRGDKSLIRVTVEWQVAGHDPEG